MHKLFRITQQCVRQTELMDRKCVRRLLGAAHARRFCSEEQKIQLPGIQEDVDIGSVTKNDPELLKKLQIIVLEADVMRQDGHKVPDTNSLKAQHWEELLGRETRSQRKKYLDFLFTIEKKKENRKRKQEEARIEREARPEYVDDGHIRYGLNHNTYLIRIYESTINQLYNNRLVRAMQFGQKIVVDCGYDDNMTVRERTNAAKQLMLLFAENRMHQDPFDLHYCNANFESTTMQSLERHIPMLREKSFPLNVHESSYLDIFPREQLVYLTPHCRDELLEYDHDAVYIIGAIVDKVNNEPLSMAKAKREGIRMAKLPLDRYLQWGSGSGKSLTINQMVSILLDVKQTNDWAFALRHVPRRKVTEASVTLGGDRYSLSYDKTPTWRDKKVQPKERSFQRKSNRNDFLTKLMKN